MKMRSFESACVLKRQNNLTLIYDYFWTLKKIGPPKWASLTKWDQNFLNKKKNKFLSFESSCSETQK